MISNHKSIILFTILFFSSLLTIQSLSSKKSALRKIADDQEIARVLEEYTNLINNVAEKEIKNFRNPEHISHEEFHHFFKNSTFGRIAKNLANDTKYVQEYYDFFARRGKLNEESFIDLLGLFYLEEQLLIAGKHPTLSYEHPNLDEENRNANEIALRYWNAILRSLVPIDKRYAVILGVDERSLARILLQSGVKSQVAADAIAEKSLDFFSENEEPKLNKHEFHLMYASIYFVLYRHR